MLSHGLKFPEPAVVQEAAGWTNYFCFAHIHSTNLIGLRDFPFNTKLSYSQSYKMRIKQTWSGPPFGGLNDRIIESTGKNEKKQGLITVSLGEPKPSLGSHFHVVGSLSGQKFSGY